MCIGSQQWSRNAATRVLRRQEANAKGNEEKLPFCESATNLALGLGVIGPHHVSQLQIGRHAAIHMSVASANEPSAGHVGANLVSDPPDASLRLSGGRVEIVEESTLIGISIARAMGRIATTACQPRKRPAQSPPLTTP